MVWIFRIFIIFFAGVLFATSAFGCGSKEPDPVAYNSSPEAQQKRLEEYYQSEQKAGQPGAYKPPAATFGDKVDNKVNELKNAVNDDAKSAGQMIAIFIFHVLMLLIPLLVIFLIPGFAVGDQEMLIEAGILIVVAIVLMCANWIGELALTGWVAFSMLIPAILLFFVGLSGRKEGWWKILLILGPPVFMTGLAMLRVLDSAMTALVHGSFLALFVVALLLYFGFRKDDEGHGSPSGAAHS